MVNGRPTEWWSIEDQQNDDQWKTTEWWSMEDQQNDDQWKTNRMMVNGRPKEWWSKVVKSTDQCADIKNTMDC